MSMDEAIESSPALKAFSLLEIIAAMDHPPTLAELTETANLPKPTLHRWLSMLEGAELLRRLPDGRRYELAERATALAFAILSNNPGSTRRHQILDGVVRELGESCNLTVLQGAEVVYLDRVEASQPLRVAFQKGSRVPVHCSASGKIFLSAMPKGRRDRLIATVKLVRHTENTLVEPEALAAELDAIKHQGFSLDDEEFLTGLFCVAVPILDRTGRECIAALALQGPVVRLSRDNAEARLPTLRDAARALAATLT